MAIMRLRERSSRTGRSISTKNMIETMLMKTDSSGSSARTHTSREIWRRSNDSWRCRRRGLGHH
jgi:hypothetical protein